MALGRGANHIWSRSVADRGVLSWVARDPRSNRGVPVIFACVVVGMALFAGQVSERRGDMVGLRADKVPCVSSGAWLSIVCEDGARGAGRTEARGMVLDPDRMTKWCIEGKELVERTRGRRGLAEICCGRSLLRWLTRGLFSIGTEGRNCNVQHLYLPRLLRCGMLVWLNLQSVPRSFGLRLHIIFARAMACSRTSHYHCLRAIPNVHTLHSGSV